MTATEDSLEHTGKKAVHVKWAGKTIALGTFSVEEADEKCAKAKALTRCWRTNMRPKPTREWVMLELERLGIRNVNGGKDSKQDGDFMPQQRATCKSAAGGASPVPSSNSLAMNGRRNSLRGGEDMEALENKTARRSSSLGLSLLSDIMRRDSLGSLGQGIEGEATDSYEAPTPTKKYRPFVGGGAAAAYEAYRHYHFSQKEEQKPRRGSVLGGLGQMPKVTDPIRHIEMLKLHHMNLLNELQETTLMMNLYQQQQLQEQKLLLLQQQQETIPRFVNMGQSQPNSVLSNAQQHGSMYQGGQCAKPAMLQGAQLESSTHQGGQPTLPMLQSQSSGYNNGQSQSSMHQIEQLNSSNLQSEQTQASMLQGLQAESSLRQAGRSSMFGSFGGGGGFDSLRSSLALGPQNQRDSLALGVAANLRDSLALGSRLRESLALGSRFRDSFRDSLGLGSCSDLDFTTFSRNPSVQLGGCGDGFLGGLALDQHNSVLAAEASFEQCMQKKRNAADEYHAASEMNKRLKVG